MERIQDYDTFWLHYLREHRHPRNRRLHLSGSLLVIAALLWIIASGEWSYLWLCPMFGYGFAWGGHFFVEKNRPATFKYPLWSLYSDFRMSWMMLRGTLHEELRKAFK